MEGELDKLSPERKAALSDYFEALQACYQAERTREMAVQNVRAARRRLTRLAKGKK